jgi:hypothetical protein
VPVVAVVGHDFICCGECGAYVSAGDLCFGWHECAPVRREAYLVRQLRGQLDSGAFLAAANAWLADHRGGDFFEYAVWRRAYWHAQR